MRNKPTNATHADKEQDLAVDPGKRSRRGLAVRPEPTKKLTTGHPVGPGRSNDEAASGLTRSQLRQASKMVSDLLKVDEPTRKAIESKHNINLSQLETALREYAGDEDDPVVASVRRNANDRTAHILIVIFLAFFVCPLFLLFAGKEAFYISIGISVLVVSVFMIVSSLDIRVVDQQGHLIRTIPATEPRRKIRRLPFAIDILLMVHSEVHDIICNPERRKRISVISEGKPGATISALAAFIVAKTDLSEPIALGFAVYILVLSIEVSVGVFCKVTPEQLRERLLNK